MTNGQPRAFVLISFEDQFESVYTDLIKTPLEEVGFHVERADSQLNQRSILQDIVRGIALADLIVADLTGMNPNVMYELGIAHALEIPTILLTQNIEELPFDLRAYRANEYSTHFSEAPRIQASLRELGEGRQSGSLAFGSPVTDFLPPEFRLQLPAAGVASTAEGGGGDTGTQEEQEDDEEAEQEAAWFDTMASAVEANERFIAAMNRITNATEAVGSRSKTHSDQLAKLTASNDPQRVKKMSNLFIRFANDLDSYAGQVETELPTVEENASANLDAMLQFLAWLQTNPHLEPGDEVADLQETVTELYETTHESLGSLREYRETVRGLRGVSRPINSASDRVVRALDRLIAITETVESQSSRILAASDEVLARHDQIEDVDVGQPVSDET